MYESLVLGLGGERFVFLIGYCGPGCGFLCGAPNTFGLSLYLLELLVHLVKFRCGCAHFIYFILV